MQIFDVIAIQEKQNNSQIQKNVPKYTNVSTDKTEENLITMYSNCS